MFNVEQIIKSIRSNLTGNSYKDLTMLEEMYAKYENHPNSKEIIQELNIIAFSLLNEKDQIHNVEECYQEIGEMIAMKKYEDAYESIEDLIKKIEPYKVKGTYDIHEDIEAVVIYSMNHLPIENSRLPYSKVYELEGIILARMERYDEAIQALDHAIEWNPGCNYYRIEKADLYRLKGDIEQFMTLNLNLFPYLCKAEYVSTVYRNIGYYLIEKKDYENAICSLTLSLNYQESDSTYQELSYIQNILQHEIDYPTMEKMERMSKKYHIPLSLNEELLSYIYTFGMNYLEKNKETGKYLLHILYDLTKDEELSKY